MESTVENPYNWIQIHFPATAAEINEAGSSMMRQEYHKPSSFLKSYQLRIATYPYLLFIKLH